MPIEKEELLALTDKIESLELEVAKWKRECAGMGRVLQGGLVIPTDQYGALRAERDRFREALDKIADPEFRPYTLDSFRKLARQALFPAASGGGAT